MHTLGYSFSPWEDAKAIADGPSILRYVAQTATRYGVMDRIRTGHARHRRGVLQRPRRAGPSTSSAGRHRRQGDVHLRLSVHAAAATTTTRRGTRRDFAGVERFPGPIVHPQHWPEDLDYAGKRVLVIGSGATAVTLVPAMAETAAHVTMLQRSPSYVVSLPSRDGFADVAAPPAARAGRLPPRARQERRADDALATSSAAARPKLMKAIIRRGAQRQLPAGYDVDTHFKPDYDPWDQRLCIVARRRPVRALTLGRARRSSPTRSQTFTERGVQLRGGEELEADVIVTATGLRLLALGGDEPERGRRARATCPSSSSTRG